MMLNFLHNKYKVIIIINKIIINNIINNYYKKIVHDYLYTKIIIFIKISFFLLFVYCPRHGPSQIAEGGLNVDQNWHELVPWGLGTFVECPRDPFCPVRQFLD